MADSPPPPHIGVWVNPPSRPIPVTKSPCRFAVGTPEGASTNSWKVWVRGGDTYVACRDSFSEFKLSLHASGVWRFGLTAEAVLARPDLLEPGADRVWSKWQPALDEAPVVIGFQILVPRESLYLQPAERGGWPTSIVFAEPPASPADMSVVSVTVARTRTPLRMTEETRGVVVGMLPLGEERTVQLVVTHQPAAPLRPVLENGLATARAQMREKLGQDLPPAGVVVLHGTRDGQIPWIAALPSAPAGEPA